MTKKPPDIPDPFMNIAEAVQKFDVSRRTLQRSVKAGEIPFKTSKNGRQDKYLDPAILAEKYELRNKSGTGDKVSQDFEPTRSDAPNVTPDDTLLLKYQVSMLEQRIEELSKERAREREEYTRREEDLRREKERLYLEKEKLLGIIEKQTLIIEDKREKRKQEPVEEKPESIPEPSSLPNNRRLKIALIAAIIILSIVTIVSLSRNDALFGLGWFPSKWHDFFTPVYVYFDAFVDHLQL